MYSTSTPFSEIKPVRPALLLFAVQKVKDKLVREAKDAMLPSSGLHATTSDYSTRKANWADDFARNQQARLLPITDPLLRFQCSCKALCI
jgi:hypothetical protein